ncbi:hypothetical protein BV22DRAFT_926718 [Leucogyrophana mollusca]|uniref:Uncharacterized protein n=1 Tax=Leucogyrophana mollusca TaxID=85980 RepID=A0ACB8AWB1_9AGAM|nr:hypothetical protein BV22DRAFT_926718 [Leucogyrophana mollusca]
MQAILLLRAYALCNRSRKVLVFLLVSFVCETIVIVVVIVKSLDLVATRGSGAWSRLPSRFICGLTWPSHTVTPTDPADSVLKAHSVKNHALELWQTVSRAIQLAFDILLLVIALFGSVRHALEAKGWSVNPLVKALAEDQIAYFVRGMARNQLAYDQ